MACNGVNHLVSPLIHENSSYQDKISLTLKNLLKIAGLPWHLRFCASKVRGGVGQVCGWGTKISHTSWGAAKKKEGKKKPQKTKANRSIINSPRRADISQSSSLKTKFLGANKIFVCLFVKHTNNTNPVSRLVVISLVYQLLW